MPSSFFSTVGKTLDPDLFQGTSMIPSVRDRLLGMVLGTLGRHFNSPEAWSRSWVAGSGASYHWASARLPRDLDVLVGIDYVAFRMSNPDRSGLGDQQIADYANTIFRDELQPHTADWNGFEVTFYTNKRGWDITVIKPYAAYSLSEDGWTVPPSTDVPVIPEEWEQQAESIRRTAQSAVEWYGMSLRELQNASNPAHRANAERSLHQSLDQASALYDSVHNGRRASFGPAGEGYADKFNFLWQAGKRDEWLFALKQMKDYREKLVNNPSTYGVELPDTDTLLLRAATSYLSQQ